jgi:hypothetical protein
MDMSSVLVPSFNNRAVIWFKRRKVMAGTACPPAAPQRCLTDSGKRAGTGSKRANQKIRGAAQAVQMRKRCATQRRTAESRPLGPVIAG